MSMRVRTVALALGAAAWAGCSARAQPCARASLALPDFSDVSALTFVGSAAQNANEIRLTRAGQGEAGAAWFSGWAPKIAEAGWYTAFSFRLDGQADGFAFVLQDGDASQLGEGGSGLGYAGIPRSVAVEFDTFSFSGEFPQDHVSVQTQFGGSNSNDDSSSLAHSVLSQDLNDGEVHTALIAYDGTVLRVWVDHALEIAQAVDLGNEVTSDDGCAIVGFTGGSGAATADQSILSWSLGEGGMVYTDFSSTPGMQLVGSTTRTGGALRLTTTQPGQRGGAWETEVHPNVQSPWTTTFEFRLTGTADGFAFVVQSESDSALGGSGSALGYSGGESPGITHCVAVEFDTFSFPGEIPADHVSIQTNFAGENSSDDSSSLASAVLDIDLNDEQTHTCTVSYDGARMFVLLDGVLILQAAIDLTNGIADELGEAWVGFTAGTGGATADQDILWWGFGQAGDCIPPEISEYIFDQSAAQGSPVVLHFAGSGSLPRQYFWVHNGDPVVDGGPISGATTNTLTISPVGPEHDGQWDYALGNDCGGVGSGFFLTVTPACDPDFTQDGNSDQDDVAYLIGVIAGGDNPTGRDPDFTLDGNADQDDVSALINVIAGGDCP